MAAELIFVGESDALFHFPIYKVHDTLPVPESIRKDADAMPASLRALLEAELAAGNEIAEVGHSFPARAERTGDAREEKSG